MLLFLFILLLNNANDNGEKTKTYVEELLGGGAVAEDIVDGDDSTLGVLGTGEVGLALLAVNLGREGDELALVVPLCVLDGGGVAAGGGQRHFLL